MMNEADRIKSILKWLPVIRKIIKLGGCWEQLKGICIPLELSDTAFRDHPRITDYLMKYSYWKKQLNERSR